MCWWPRKREKRKDEPMLSIGANERRRHQLEALKRIRVHPNFISKKQVQAERLRSLSKRRNQIDARNPRYWD